MHVDDGKDMKFTSANNDSLGMLTVEWMRI